MDEREVFRRRHSFPLSTLLLVVAVAGVFVAFITNWQLWNKHPVGRVDSASLEWVKWAFAAEDDRRSKQIELFLIPDRNPEKWAWVVRNNTDTLYNLYLGTKPIPAGKAPSRHSDATLASQTFNGSCLIAIECTERSLTRVVCPLEPVSHGATALSNGGGLSLQGDSAVEFTAGEFGVELHGTTGPITLLRIAPSAVSRSNIDGLVVWIEPIGKRPPP